MPLSFSFSFCLHLCLCCLLLSGGLNLPGGKMNVLMAAGWRRWPGSLALHWSLGLALLGNCKCCGINGGCILVPIVDRLLAAALCKLPPRLWATSAPSRIREGSVRHTSSFLMCCYSGCSSEVCPDCPLQAFPHNQCIWPACSGTIKCNPHIYIETCVNVTMTCRLIMQ